MTIKIKGLVLKISTTIHDNRLLYILTEERGRIQIFDNRHRTNKRNMFDLYTYCEFVVFENRGKYTLNSAVVLEDFFQLRKNLAASALAGYFSQLCLFATQDGQSFVGNQLSSLMLNSLFLLCSKPEQIFKVKTVFEWKMIQWLGFAPSLESCEHMSFDDCVLLSVEDGGLYCTMCVPTDKNASAFTVTSAEVKAIVFVLEQPPSKAFSFKLPEAAMKNIGLLSEEYLKYHCAQSFSALEIYKVIG